MSIEDMVLEAQMTEFNNSVATRMEEWRTQVSLSWDKQKDQFLGQSHERAFTGMANVSLWFTDTTKQAISLACNMVMGHVVWTKAYKNGDKSAKLDITSELTEVDGNQREVLTFTYGGEYVGKVTRITGLAGVGRPLTMGVEVSTSPYDAETTAQA